MYFITNGTLYWPFTILDWNYIIEPSFSFFITVLQASYMLKQSLHKKNMDVFHLQDVFGLSKLYLSIQALLWDTSGACTVSTTGISVCFNGHMESFCALTRPNESRSRLNKVRLRLWDAQCPRAVCDRHRERKQAASRIQMTGETIPTKLIYYLSSASTWSPVACYCEILIFYWLLPCVNCPIKFCNSFAKWTKNSNLNKLYAMLHRKIIYQLIIYCHI